MIGGRGFISMDFVGLDGLEQALRDLGSDKDVRKSMSDAMVQAAEPMAKAMRAGARPSVAETIDVSKTLSRRARRQAAKAEADSGGLSVTVYVGPKPRGQAVLDEFGTSNRHWKTGKSTGSTAARPFMRPGFEQEKFGTIERYGKLLWIQIAKAANRIAKRQMRALKK